MWTRCYVPSLTYSSPAHLTQSICRYCKLNCLCKKVKKQIWTAKNPEKTLKAGWTHWLSYYSPLCSYRRAEQVSSSPFWRVRDKRSAPRNVYYNLYYHIHQNTWKHYGKGIWWLLKIHRTLYTHENTRQVVTICKQVVSEHYKSVHKLSTSCVGIACSQLL